MKFILSFILIFIINFSGNKVSNYHGKKSLQSKYDKIQEKTTNKNDIMKLIGPPSTVSDFDKNKWFYFERLKSNQSIFKLGTQKIKKNNILIVKFSENGLVENKQILNLNNMNDLKYFNKENKKEFKNNNVIYNVFSSLREKINAPARNRKK